MLGKTPPPRVVARVFIFALMALSLTAAAQTPARRQTQEQGAKSITHQKEDPPIVELPSRARRYALVIGIDKYTADGNITTLKGAANDAKAIAEALVKYADFDRENVVVLTSDEADTTKQPTKTVIMRALKNMKGYIEPGGMLVVAFSGHGVERQSDHKVFLLPADASSNPDDYEESAIPVDRVKELIRQTSANQVMLLLDSCRNDPTAGKGSEDNKLTQNYAEAFNMMGGGVKAFATLYAASPGQRAWEYQEKRQGYFSWAFVEGLKGLAKDPNTGEVTLDGLTTYVASEVERRARMAGRNQRPWIVKEGYGDKLVLSRTAPAVAPKPVVVAAPPPPAPTTGTLTVVSAPGAQITIEPLFGDRTQVKQGAVPQTGEPVYNSAPLPFGKYLVTATREGYGTLKEERELAPGKVSPVLLPIKEATYKVTLRTNISKGRVEFGPKGAPPVSYPLSGGQVVAPDLRRGEYALKIIPDEVGFEPKAEVVNVSGDLDIERRLERRLRKMPLDADFSLREHWQPPPGWSTTPVLTVDGAGRMMLRADDGRFADFELSANVELVGGTSVSFIVRAADEQNYYLVRLCGPNADRQNALQFYLVKDGKERLIQNFKLPTVKLRDQFRFNVKAVGGNFKFYIDDNNSDLVLVGNVDESTLAAGTVGVAAGQGDKAKIFQYVILPGEYMTK
ncbi:MAG TPA: caspase family protein [Pyrinomonadaceae bacterium]